MARKKLQGQAAIITGGGRGIGAAAAYQLAAAGAALVLTARSEEEVEAIAAQIRKNGGRAIAAPGDISDFAHVEEVVESALGQFDRVDILVNAAGLLWPLEEAAETDPEEWAYNIQVNLVAPFAMMQNVLPLMKAQRYGRIVNLGDSLIHLAPVGLSAYTAAKAGLEMFTRVMAKEAGAYGVNVNLLYPGAVNTAFQTDLRSVDTSESELDFSQWQTLYEQKALFDAEIAARAIYWLVGPWSRQHNGQCFDLEEEAFRRQINQDLGL
jgi:NAD(P)-dependent dehydrogenase (short-subunit alcohol dehydrogenase family)